MGGAQLPAMSNLVPVMGSPLLQPVVVGRGNIYRRMKSSLSVRLTLSPPDGDLYSQPVPASPRQVAATTASNGPQPVSYGHLKGNMSRWR